MASPVSHSSSAEITSPQSSSINLPPPPSGLPSKPRLVARTGAPTDPEAYYQLKELRTVSCDHAISEIWEDGLASEVQDLLNSMTVQWTSLDVIGFKNIEHFSGPPPTLWIGVHSASLSGTDGVVVAYKCRDVLVECGITDVDVEIRESEAA